MKVNLFKNGKIYSMKREKDSFKNMLVINGKVVFTSDEEISVNRYLNDKECKVEIFDLEGKSCIPSFCDAHIHFTFGANTFEYLNLSNLYSIEDIFKEIELYIENKIKINDFWIICYGYDKNNLKNSEELNIKNIESFINSKFKNLKDSLYVLIFSKDYHSAYVNINLLNLINKRLKLVKSSFFTKILKTNEIENYNEIINSIDYENGIFYESALKFLTNSVNDLVNEDYSKIIERIKRFIKYLYSNGITATTDCSLLWKDSSFKYFQKLEHEEVKFRNLVCIPEDALDKFIDLNLITNKGSNYFKVGPLKLIYDGSVGSQTALLFKQYENKNSFGFKNYKQNFLKEVIDKCLKNNIGLAIHAIGDRANSEVVDLFSNIRSLNSNILLRLEHGQILRDEEIEKIKHLNLFVIMQPVHIDQDYFTYEKYLKDYMPLSYRFKSLMKNNINVAFSTDFPVADINPFFGIFCAITQEGFEISKGKIFNINEKIDLFNAIKNYTYFSHKSSLFENSGLIAEGFNADFIVLDKDIFDIDNEYELLDIKVLRTFFEGEEVFKSY